MGTWIKKLIEKFQGKQPEVAATKEVQPEQPREFFVDRAPKPKKVEKKLPDFGAMTKKELDEWASNNLKLKLDRRKKKDYMIEQIQNHLSKEK